MATWREKACFKVMSNDEKRRVYFEVQRLATEQDYGSWWRGKARIASQHKIGIIHVNAIIRLVSGKSSSVPKFHRRPIVKCTTKIHHIIR